LAIVHFPLKLVARRMIAPSVAHLSFVRDDGQPLDYIPGQFIQVHFAYADGTATKRSYSLATQHDHALAPGEAVEIAVSYVPAARRRRCSRACRSAAASMPAARTAGSA
jgi:ferredoxin-NADP reductase